MIVLRGPAETEPNGDLPEGEREIKLAEALRFLCEVHTRDDPRGAGYVVMIGATPDFASDYYVRCWGVVRAYLAKCEAIREQVESFDWR